MLGLDLIKFTKRTFIWGHYARQVLKFMLPCMMELINLVMNELGRNELIDVT